MDVVKNVREEGAAVEVTNAQSDARATATGNMETVRNVGVGMVRRGERDILVS
jgi:hypothetical protein